MGKGFDFSILDDESRYPYGADPDEYELVGAIAADGAWYRWGDTRHGTDDRLGRADLRTARTLPGLTIPLHISGAYGAPVPFAAGKIKMLGADLELLLRVLGVEAGGGEDLVASLAGRQFAVIAGEGYGGAYNHESLEVTSLRGPGGVFDRGQS
jgi:hypothetical protein